MNYNVLVGGIGLTLVVGAVYLFSGYQLSGMRASESAVLEEGAIAQPAVSQKSATVTESATEKTALFANGCFWCVEADLEKVAGVINVISGYAGGSTENPTYENYAAGGHREVVHVTYDPAQVTYANLVEHIIKHGDPTDHRARSTTVA